MTSTSSRLPRSAKPRLAALLDGQLAGWVYQTGDRRLLFQYQESWRADDARYPLSLSMPLTAATHGHRAVSAFLWGLLPDNQETLEWWAKRYRANALDVTSLLAHVGEECAGAVQFASPERVEHLLIDAASLADAPIEWLSEDEVGERLRALRENPGAGRLAGDSGQFSLAGAQAKIALYEAPNGRWGIPAGRMPTNRILKPPAREFVGLAFVEHWSLALAHEVGLRVARSRVQRFGDEDAIVVDRYDRASAEGELLRIHQEDLCQSLAVPPTSKYEDNGGPGIEAIVSVLTRWSSDPAADIAHFLDAVAFNWLIAGTDAHAKNYSLLISGGSQVRVAPLYDVISVLPYPMLMRGGARLAMRVGGEARVDAITGAEWLRQADELGVSPLTLIERVGDIAISIPPAFERLEQAVTGGTEAATSLARLHEVVERHARACLSRL